MFKMIPTMIKLFIVKFMLALILKLYLTHKKIKINILAPASAIARAEREVRKSLTDQIKDLLLPFCIAFDTSINFI